LLEEAVMGTVLKWVIYAILMAAVVWILQILIRWIRRREKDIEDE
jgi:hypothetical protein